MKKLLLLSAIIFAAACSSPQKDAESLIKKFMKENLNDPKSYEIVEFTEIDSLWTNTDRLSSDFEFEAGSMERNHQHMLDMFEITNDRQYLDSAKIIMDKWDLAIKDIKKTIAEFEPEFKGFRVYHKYRAKNAMGATTLSIMELHLNPELTKIVGHQEIE